MTPQEKDQKDSKSGSPDDDKTVVLQRCPKHGTVFMPDEGCPECKKEKSGSAG